MADIESNIKISIDTSSALENIKNLQRQVSAFQSSLANAGASAASAASNMQQNFINSVNATGKFSAGITNIKTTTESFTNALEKNKLSMGEYFRYAGGASKSFGKLFKTEFDTINRVATERVKDLQTQYIKLGRDVNGSMKAISVRPLALDMENLATKQAIASQRQQLLNQLLKQGSTNLLNFGKNTQWAGRQLMVGFTIPLIAAGSAATKAYMQLEKASIAIRKVYGDLNTSAADTEQAVRQIQKLALEYTKYGVAVADTMDMAAKAAAMGKTGADLLAQINQAVKLSVLGGVDQQMALETTISLTNAFGLATEKLAGKVNFLNAVENQTVLAIEDMTIAIPKAAPVVKQLGGDVEDLAFFLTAMKEGGINASEGANALKSGLASLINPTKASSDFLMQFGVNVKQIVEADKGDLKKTVVDFAKALDTLDPLNRARAIEQMFGKFQFARISTLLQNVVKEGSQASKVMDLASMSSIQLAAVSRKELEKMEASPMFKFQKALAELQLKLAPIGETFLKVVTPIIEKVSGFLEGFNKMGDSTKQFILGLTVVVAGLGPVLLMTFGLIANGVANITKGFATLKSFFNRTTNDTMILGEQTSFMTQEQIKAHAVAASLDQIHTKLTQTFTTEASAVNAYTAALERAVVVQSSYSGATIPRTRTNLPKFAGGGMVRGPGTGTSDSILARVSNGEAIIPAKSVARHPDLVSALVSGNIPGFEDGIDKLNVNKSTTQSGLQRGHIAPVLTSTPAGQQAIASSPFGKLSSMFTPFISVVGNLVADMSTTMNQKLKNAGMSSEDFSADFNSRSGRLLGSARLAGLDIEEKETKAALDELQKKVGERAVQLGKGTVTDRELEKATMQILKEEKKSKTLGPAASALGKLANTPGAVRMNVPSAKIDELIASGQVEKIGRKYVDVATGVEVGRTGKTGTNSKRTPSQYDIGRNYKRGAPTLSRLTEPIPINLAGKITEQTAEKTISTSKKVQQSALNELQLKKKNLEMMGQDVSAIEKEIAQRKALAQTILSAPQANPTPELGPVLGPAKPTMRQKVGSKIQSAKNFVSGAAGNVAGKLASNLGGVSIAASMAAGALSMVPGPIGQIAQTVMPIVSAMSMAAMVLPMFGTAIAGAILPITLAVGALVGGFMLVNHLIDQSNKARQAEIDQINNTSNAFKNAAKASQELATLTGVTPKTSLLNVSKTAFKTGGSTASQTNDVNTLLESDTFTNPESATYQMIQNVKKMNTTQASSFLTGFGQQKIGEGYDEKTLNSLMLAIQSAAGKKDLDITFKSINLNSPQGIKKVQDSINSMFSELKNIGTELDLGQFGVTRILSKDDEIRLNNFINTAAPAMSNMISGISDQFASGQISSTKYTNSIEAVTKSLLEMKDKGVQARIIKQMFADIDPAAVALANSVSNVSDKMKMYNIIALGGMKAVTQMLGEMPAVIQSADKAVRDSWVGQQLTTILASTMKDAAKIYNDAQNTITDTTKNTTKATKELPKTIADIIKGYEELSKVSTNQVNAFRKLREAGIDAASAYEIVSDAEAAYAISTEKSADKIKEAANAWLRSKALAQLAKDPLQVEIDKSQLKLDINSSQINTYNDALSIIGDKEKTINDEYDKRIKALDEIQAANKEINQSQKDQMDLAEALSKGDIAAAAKAAQTMRDNASQNAIDKQKEALSKSKDLQVQAITQDINGKLMTRLQIEEKIRAVQLDSYNIQLKEIDPLKEKLALQAQLQQSKINGFIAGGGATTTSKSDLLAWAQTKSTDKYEAIMGYARQVSAAKTDAAKATPRANALKIYAQLQNEYNGFASGGMVMPKYFAAGGFSMGTDIVPAMLTPGEFIVSQPAVRNFGVDNLKSINNGTYDNGSVYNYSVNVSVRSGANADEIARNVMTQIKQIDSQRVRGINS